MGRKKREFVDLTGQKFGRLTVLGLAEPFVDKSGRKYETWHCQCECGNVRDIYVQHLIHGQSKSCGCLAKDTCGDNFRTHGKTHARLYNTWGCMRGRCNCKANPAYKNYGGRGITVCEEWDDYEKFEEWAMTNGYEEGLTIDRINNDKGYSPDNCRWATYKEQANNTRNTRRFTVDGETKTASEWSEMYGVPNYEIFFRINHGWTEEEAIKIPLHSKRTESA